MSDQEFAIDFDRDAIVEFCRKWKIREMSLFGSVLNPEEFRDDSDVDVLVVLDEGPRDWGPWGSKWEEMAAELGTIFGHKADVVQRKLVKNPFIRHSILTTHQKIYAVLKNAMLHICGISLKPGDRSMSSLPKLASRNTYCTCCFHRLSNGNSRYLGRKHER